MRFVRPEDFIPFELDLVCGFLQLDVVTKYPSVVSPNSTFSF